MVELVLEATIDLLISLYNANTERYQLTLITIQSLLLNNFKDFHDIKLICAGDFNLIFDKNLESARGSPLL